MKIKLGRYVCPGQVPIVVTSKGTPTEVEEHGPWIEYHLALDTGEGEKPQWAQSFERPQTVWYELFYGLLDSGYVHESEDS